jgi:FtsZ-binding cell division protein ZapB
MLNFRNYFKRDADSGTETGGTPNDAVENVENKVETSIETKTYTQDELNQQLKANKKTVQENILKELGVKDFDSAKNGIKKYLEEIEKNKTDLEKATDTINSNAAEIANLKAENNTLLLTNKALIAGVKSDTINDFIAIVNSRVSADKTADDVIKELKANTAFTGFFETSQETKSTGTGSPIGQHKDAKGNNLNYGEYLAQKWLGNNKVTN